jgi:hypothetical protein
MTLRQREPREVDEAYLAFVRKQPCTVCRRPGPNDAAHVRAPALHYGKRQTGKGEKPSDRWTLPLCRTHHEAQHRTNELRFWASYGIDPFALCEALYASRPGASRPRREPRRRIVKTVARKPAEQRRKVGQGRPLPGRGEGRKLQSRKMETT